MDIKDHIQKAMDALAESDRSKEVAAYHLGAALRLAEAGSPTVVVNVSDRLGRDAARAIKQALDELDRSRGCTVA